MLRITALCSLVLCCALAVAQDKPLLENGSFEAVKTVKPDANGIISGWKLAGEPLLPGPWVLNSHYTGTLEMPTDTPQDGRRYVRLTGGPNGGHIYQPLQGVTPGQWYKITLFARGRGGEISAYHYFKTGPMGGAQLGRLPAAEQWRQFATYWQAPAENFASASLALSAATDQTLEVDDVRIEPLAVPAVTPGQKDIVFENDVLRFAITPLGLLSDFTCKPTKQSYLGEPSPLPVVTLVRDGRTVPTHGVSAQGDRITFRFLEPEVSATLRITARPTHFLIEVVDVQPADVDSLSLQFPVKRLAKLGWAFGATYGDTFGMCLFCASINSHNRMSSQPQSAVLGGTCDRKHGMVGAKFVLIGAPAAQFKPAVIAAEKANGLPCPIIGGKWGRDSESNRKSYLFATGSSEAQIDTLIQYAKTGGFGTIIFLKDDWLANHGHFDINTRNFPDGLASLQRSVKKIHAAGLEAGVHVFGPSISPNDPYITPKPDPRLAGFACPPLAEALDDQAKTFTLTGQAKLPPVGPYYQGFPGSYVQIGDEIISYGKMEPGPPSRFVNCVRGALGTKASAHAAGEPVKGLLAMWGFLLVDPDSTLADEVTGNFAKAFNACNFDFAYFDASDGINDAYLDRWYYLNRMHMGYWQKISRSIIYQTSNGTGSDLCWHIIPRSASADGHGDIKGYLDDRWPGILGMGNNWIKADIGWYYWFRDVRPDQIEYVCARALGIDGSISLETSVSATEALAQSRQMYEMLGRWERARRANVFPPAVKAKLLEMKRDFKVFEDGKGGWQLYRAAYEEPRVLDVLNGVDNVFTVNNDLGQPCALGFELVRHGKGQLVGNYDDPQAKTVETFDETQPYYASETNRFAPFVVGDKTEITPMGIVRQGTTFSFGLTEDARVGGHALQMKATNKSDVAGWTGIGRRFAAPLDLRGFKGAALWIKGDAVGEVIRVQFRDTAGRSADILPAINYTGWRLHFVPLPTTGGFDWSKVEYLLFYFNNIPPGKSVDVTLDDLKLLPDLHDPPGTGRPTLTVNERNVPLPDLQLGQAISHEGVGGVKHWAGGFAPATPLRVPPASLQLQPGANKVTIGWSDPAAFPGNLQVLVYRVWPMEK
ncbi:hypothetical protein LLH23_22190 [bacterium]|nr:hypothetical protein [bacterium]